MARTRSYYRNQMATVAWLHGTGNRYGGRDAEGDVSEQNQIISYELGPGGLASAQAAVKKKRRGRDGPSNVAAETCPRGGGGEDGRCLDLVVAERVIRRPVVIEIDSDSESDSDKGLESDHDSDLNLEDFVSRHEFENMYESFYDNNKEVRKVPWLRPKHLPHLMRSTYPGVLHQLRVWSGEQDRVVMASATQHVFQPIVTTSVVGTFVLPIVQLDDHPGVFLIRLLTRPTLTSSTVMLGTGAGRMSSSLAC
ncbi:hypothetical protein HU200_013774 [Digitaria exilis]|uniref:Uncharacterized protein n=1 Tax=Digitaria exilis TaxID=1010633 RepID=A0A835FDC6_9POAL|nr:hypothetical protein HU200_013774 [Digitaria exilis]